VSSPRIREVSIAMKKRDAGLPSKKGGAERRVPRRRDGERDGDTRHLAARLLRLGAGKEGMP
jgi:hypothetical protein